MSSLRDLLNALVGQTVGVNWADGSFTIDFGPNILSGMILAEVGTDVIRLQPSKFPLVQQWVAIAYIREVYLRAPLP
jgi:hypothetical protein